MTVGELRKIIENLPDDMTCATHDVGGNLDFDFCNAKVIDPFDMPKWLRFTDITKPFLLF
jgi:hypothetical protein